MTPQAIVEFGPFRLDLAHPRLWQDEVKVELRPMSLAVLGYLAAHSGQVVTKQELISQVWAGQQVSEVGVRVCVREIRQALGETATTPRYLHTMGRQGYRFVGEPKTDGAAPAGAHPGASGQPMVGREGELRLLEGWLARAQTGNRQMVFVTGEPGIGKTALVTPFPAQLRATESVRRGPGPCVEQDGGGGRELAGAGEGRRKGTGVGAAAAGCGGKTGPPGPVAAVRFGE